MLTTFDLLLLLLAALGLVAGGYLLALRHVWLEKSRATQAEGRAQSYLALLQGLAGSTLTAGPDGAQADADSAVSRPAAREAAGGSRPSSVTDSRYLFVSFEEEIRRARGKGIPLTLLTLCLENADGAHPDDESNTTSRLLRSVAHLLRGQMRGCDTCVRYAANQFILILPGVSRDEARRVERRLRVALHALSHETSPGVSIRPRASLGSATFPEDGGSFDQLLTLGDSRRFQDSTAALPGLPPPSRTAPRQRVPPPVLSRN